MKVTNLHIEDMRAIERASFAFEKDFNLLVGVNGVGKSTILDALAISLSKIIRDKTKAKYRTKPLDVDDIRMEKNELIVECQIEHSMDVIVHSLSASINKSSGELERHDQFSGSRILSVDPANGGQPLAILFSTNRAVPMRRSGMSPKSLARNSIVVALDGAFAKRQLHLSEISHWVYARETLSAEDSVAANMLSAFDSVLGRFIPGCSNLHTDQAARNGRRELMITKDHVTVPVRNLSDGERGILSIVLDITRRLSLANPECEDPSSEAEAIILIDEIDLHLHPKWQRSVIKSFIKTFPKCQFIATTHSPQVIGEAQPHQIHIIPSDGEVYSPSHSYGVDSSRILEEIMDTEPRDPEVDNLLHTIGDQSSKNQFELVRRSRNRLASLVGEDDPEVVYIDSYLSAWSK